MPRSRVTVGVIEGCRVVSPRGEGKVAEHLSTVCTRPCETTPTPRSQVLGLCTLTYHPQVQSNMLYQQHRRKIRMTGVVCITVTKLLSPTVTPTQILARFSSPMLHPVSNTNPNPGISNCHHICLTNVQPLTSDPWPAQSVLARGVE